MMNLALCNFPKKCCCGFELSVLRYSMFSQIILYCRMTTSFGMNVGPSRGLAVSSEPSSCRPRLCHVCRSGLLVNPNSKKFQVLPVNFSGGKTRATTCRGNFSKHSGVISAEMFRESLSYKKAGVDIDAGSELVRRIAKMAPGIGGFGGLFPFGMFQPSANSRLYSEPILTDQS